MFIGNNSEYIIIINVLKNFSFNIFFLLFILFLIIYKLNFVTLKIISFFSVLIFLNFISFFEDINLLIYSIILEYFLKTFFDITFFTNILSIVLTNLYF